MKVSNNLLFLLEYLSNKAKLYYNKALKYVNKKNQDYIKSFLILSDIKLSILREIEKNNFNVINQKVKITPLKKIFILYKYV